jgi:hypothetical protein
MTTFLIVLYLTVCAMLMVKEYREGASSLEGWNTQRRLAFLFCLIWPPLLLITSLLQLALNFSPALRQWNQGSEEW